MGAKSMFRTFLPAVFWTWLPIAAVIAMIGVACQMPIIPALVGAALLASFPSMAWQGARFELKRAAKIKAIADRRRSLANHASRIISDHFLGHPQLRDDAEAAKFTLLLRPALVIIELIATDLDWTLRHMEVADLQLHNHIQLMEALRDAGLLKPDHVWYDINALARGLAVRPFSPERIIERCEDVEAALVAASVKSALNVGKAS